MSSFFPSYPIFESDIKATDEQLHREDRQAETKAISKQTSETSSGWDREAFYEFAVNFGRAWKDIFKEVMSFQAVPDAVALGAIFLRPDRKIFVGTFLVVLSVLYLFVFVNS